MYQEKRLIYDVYCNTKKDDRIIVEMQQASQEFIRDRVIAYSARTISNSLTKGDRKYKFPKVISIILVDFALPDLKGSDKFMQHVTLKDDENKKFSPCYRIGFPLHPRGCELVRPSCCVRQPEPPDTGTCRRSR